MMKNTIKLTFVVILLASFAFIFANHKINAQSQSFVFTAAGDWGKKTQTDRSLQLINSLGSSFTLALGDMSYQDAGTEPIDGTTPSPWCTYIKSIVGENHPFEIVAGNHEEDSHVDGFIRNFALCLPDRMSSTGDYSTEYYFDYPRNAPLMRVIMISPNLKINGVSYDYTSGNSHYNWLVQAIDQARNSGIPWVVVGMHKNCLTMGNKPCEIGSGLLQLLINKKVDLVLQGHDHDYQRSKQLVHSGSCTSVTPGTYNEACVADNGSDGLYTKGNGPIFVIAGMSGGGGFTSLNCTDTERNYFAKAMGGDGMIWNGTACQSSGVGRGIMKFSVTSDTLAADFVMSSQTVAGSAFSDSFSIRKSGINPSPGASASPTIAPCVQPPAGAANATIQTSIPSGAYKIWARLSSQSGSVDSFYLQIDNNCPVIMGDTTIPSGQWTWIDNLDGNVNRKHTVYFNTTATHTIKLIAKEQGVKIDKILFANDLSCVPTGFGNNCLGASVSPSPTAKPGDADGDGDVDGVDYTRWLNNYNTSQTGAANGDFNNSGVVDGVDYTIWLNNYQV